MFDADQSQHTNPFEFLGYFRLRMGEPEMETWLKIRRNSTGLPMGTWLGSLVGWRTAFWIISLLTLILIVWVVSKVPDYPGQKRGDAMPLLRVFSTPGVRPVLAVVVAWMLAHNILYTYIAPFVQPAGLEKRIDLVLLAFGLAALVGIWIAGKLVDRFLRATVLISLATFALVALVFGMASMLPTIIYAGVAIWGLTFGGAATLLQTALADAAGDGADVALSMNVVAWNSAIAGAGILGGILLDSYGPVAFSWAMTVLLVIALVIAGSARAYGFTPGARLSNTTVVGH